MAHKQILPEFTHITKLSRNVPLVLALVYLPIYLFHCPVLCPQDSAMTMGCGIAIFYPVFACLTALYRLLAPSTVNMINRKKNCSPINFWAVVVVCMHGI